MTLCGEVAMFSELIIEEKLPLTECPRIVDMELSVSDDMMESGRIYSTRSENPTRALDGGRLCGDSSATLGSGWSNLAATTSWIAGNENDDRFSRSIGEVGALSLFVWICPSLVCKIELRS